MSKIAFIICTMMIAAAASAGQHYPQAAENLSNKGTSTWYLKKNTRDVYPQAKSATKGTSTWYLNQESGAMTYPKLGESSRKGTSTWY